VNSTQFTGNLSYSIFVLFVAGTVSHCAREVISTSFVESTVNQIIGKLMVTNQQMRWSPHGAHAAARFCTGCWVLRTARTRSREVEGGTSEPADPESHCRAVGPGDRSLSLFEEPAIFQFDLSTQAI
jgi:hypothetical protein